MRALAVFPRRRKREIIDQAPPALSSPRDVKLRCLEVGVCGTDREIASFTYGTPPPGEEYLVIGHECLAEVVEAGTEANGLSAGDLVVPMVRRPCPHASCPACRRGSPDFCYTGDFKERGIKEAHGFLAEHFVEKAEYLQRLPPKLREIGVLMEPLTIAEKALRQVWDVQERLPWASVTEGLRTYRGLVLGAGPVGLLGAMVLVLSGFETFVYSREKPGGLKATVAESIGARYLSAGELSVDGLMKEAGDVDLVYEATGASRLAFDVMRLMAPNAVFVFTGVPGRKAPVEVDTDRLMRDLVLKNQVLFGTVNAGRPAFEAAGRDLQTFLDRWPEAVRSLITGRYRLEEHAKLLEGETGGIKNLLVPA